MLPLTWCIGGVLAWQPAAPLGISFHALPAPVPSNRGQVTAGSPFDVVKSRAMGKQAGSVHVSSWTGALASLHQQHWQQSACGSLWHAVLELLPHLSPDFPTLLCRAALSQQGGYKGVGDVVVTTFRREGPLAFWSGFGAK